MTKNETSSRDGFPGASATAPLEQQDGSQSNRRTTAQGEIGFVGLGQMGTAMAANLAAAESQSRRSISVFDGFYGASKNRRG